MRLPDIVNQFRRKLSEARNFAQNPSQTVFRGVRKRGLEAYEQASIPGMGEKKTRSAELDQRQGQPEKSEWTMPKVPGRAVPSASERAISTPPATALGPEIRHLDYPAPLTPGDILTRGWVGRYVIGQLLQDQGWMRLYEGIQENGEDAVWIYEYSFSEAVFSDREAQGRRAAFKQLIDLNSRLGEGSDFRILKIRDVIAPPKGPCYLITQALPGGQGVADCAATLSPMQVRELLRQVLQSLQYLQAYQVHWIEGPTQRGLPHGRLGPASLWLRFSEAKLPTQEPAFFVYLSRLALWEHLFDPTLQGVATNTQDLGSLAQDFKALGSLAFELLDGNPQIDPALLDAWPHDPQVRSLYPFICRLLGTGPEDPFKSPEAAIAALRQLPPTVLVSDRGPLAVTPDHTVLASDSEPPRLWLWLLAGLLMLAAMPLVRWLVQGEAPLELAGPTCEVADGCTLTLGSLAPATQIVYAAEPGTPWNRSFFRSLSSPLATANTVLLEDALRQRLGGGSASLQKAAFKPRDRQELLTQIERGQVQAGLIRGGEALPPGLAETTVAYDGIAIFVTSSDAQRDRNLPKLVNGQISLADLRRLFTQQQQTLGKGQHPVKLYFPQGYVYSEKDAETIALFRELVFDTDEDRARFDQVQRDARQAIASLPQPPASLYAHMLTDFETPQDPNQTVIGIGFDRISRLNGQCSAYPLALTHQGKTYPILVGAEGKPLDIDFDLCGDKGAYWVNSDSFTRTDSYPLGFALAVAYPASCSAVSEDNCQTPGAMLADQLRSIEGQYLLSETGLVPVEPIQRIRRFLWRGTYARQ